MVASHQHQESLIHLAVKAVETCSLLESER